MLACQRTAHSSLNQDDPSVDEVVLDVLAHRLHASVALVLAAGGHDRSDDLRVVRRAAQAVLDELHALVAQLLANHVGLGANHADRGARGVAVDGAQPVVQILEAGHVGDGVLAGERGVGIFRQGDHAHVVSALLGHHHVMEVICQANATAA